MVTWEWEKHLSCIFKHNLPLTYCLIFFFLSSLLYFLTQKVPKTSALGKNRHKRPLLMPPQASIRSGTGAKAHSFGELKFPSSQTLLTRNGATPGFRLFAGCCGPLISAAILKIIYTRANLQTCLAQWPANKRPCIGFFNGAVSLSATDYSLLALRDYPCKRTERVPVILSVAKDLKQNGL